MSVPAGALSTTTSISITLNPTPLGGALGAVYDIGPSGTQFSTPIELAFVAPPELFLPNGQPTAAVGLASNNSWLPLSYGSFDQASSQIRGYTTHLSEYGLIPNTNDPESCCDQEAFNTCGWLTGWEVDGTTPCTAHYGGWDNTKFDQFADCYDPADNIYIAGNCQRECCATAGGWISAVAPNSVSCMWFQIPGEFGISDKIAQTDSCWQGCAPRDLLCEARPTPSAWQTPDSIDGVAFDNSLNLYVLEFSFSSSANMGYHTVQKIDPQGQATILLDHMQIPTPFSYTGHGLAVDQNGDVFVPLTKTSTAKSGVCKINGSACDTIFLADTDEYVLDLVAGPSGKLVVALVLVMNGGPGALRIVELNSSGEVLANHTGLGGGNSNYVAATVDSAGQIYFATNPITNTPATLCRLVNGGCEVIATLANTVIGPDPRVCVGLRATPSGYLVAILEGSDYNGQVNPPTGGIYYTRVVYAPDGTEVERVNMVDHIVYPNAVGGPIGEPRCLAVSADGVVARTPLVADSPGGHKVIIEPLLLNAP